MIKAIFFDVDGTLLSHKSGQVPADTRAALTQLKKKEISIFAATGRHILELDQLPVQDLPFDGYITLNGQICLDAQKNLICGSAVSLEDTKKMTAVFAQQHTPIMIVELQKMYINLITPKVIAAQKAISTPLPDIGIYTGEPVYQFIIFEEECHAAALTSSLTQCRISGWNPYAFDVIPKNGGKTAGIRHVLQSLHLRKEEIMAFGDGENDMDMLKYAGIGVAMGNAAPAVKASADHITTAAEEGGILKALTYYGVL